MSDEQLRRNERQLRAAVNALDRIGEISGWCENRDPDDAEDALYEINRVLYDWVNGADSVDGGGKS